MNIQTELYKVFYYVAKHSNISHAAKALHISQPAISKSISKLEHLTGSTLFVRHAKGVKLTSEGKALLKHVKEAFVHLELAEKTMSNLAAGEAGSVKIGISNTLCKYYFLPKLELFHDKYPYINIQIINVPSPETYDLLGNGEIDFAIMSYDEKEESCSYSSLMTLQDIFVSSKEQGIRLPVGDLQKHPIMMMEKGNQTRKYMDKFLEGNNVNITPQIEIGSMDFLVEFARIGIGTACVIKEFVISDLEQKKLFEVPIYPAPKPREMGIVIKKNVPMTKAGRMFVDMLEGE